MSLINWTAEDADRLDSIKGGLGRALLKNPNSEILKDMEWLLLKLEQNANPGQLTKEEYVLFLMMDGVQEHEIPEHGFSEPKLVKFIWNTFAAVRDRWLKGERNPEAASIET